MIFFFKVDIQIYRKSNLMVKVKNSKVNMNTDNTAKFTLQGLFWTFKRNIAASINHSPPNFLYTIRFLGCTAIFVGSPIQLKSIAYTIGVIFTHLCVQNIFSHLINHHIHRSAFVWWSTRMWLTDSHTMSWTFMSSQHGQDSRYLHYKIPITWKGSFVMKKIWWARWIINVMCLMSYNFSH